MLRWYNKETKERVYVNFPFRFLYLDQLHTVAGYDDRIEASLYGTEVRDIKDSITVYAKKTIVARGPWNKDTPLTAGVKYAKSIYFAFEDEGEWKIGNIKLTGGALGTLSEKGFALLKGKEPEGIVGWFDFCKANPEGVLTNCAVTITSSVADKKGKTDFFRPVFDTADITEEEDAAAIALDTQLQAFLTESLKARGANDDDPVEPATTKSTGLSPLHAPLLEDNDDPDDTIPF